MAHGSVLQFPKDIGVGEEFNSARLGHFEIFEVV